MIPVPIVGSPVDGDNGDGGCVVVVDVVVGDGVAFGTQTSFVPIGGFPL